MKLGILIATVVAIVGGIILIPMIVLGDKGINPLEILTYIWVAVVLLGAVAWIGGTGGGIKEGDKESRLAGYIKDYIKEHKKKVMVILAGSFIILLLWLSTFI